MTIRHKLLSLLTVLTVVFAVVPAWAEVPDTITYSGDLDKDGEPVDAMVEAQFALYDAETGGKKVWSESFDSLQVRNGHFVVELGAKEPITKVFTGQDLWLEVTIEGKALMPRNHIGVTPYAQRAAVADEADNASKLEGKTADDIKKGINASDVSYDSADSNLSANELKSAVDELAKLRDKIQSLESDIRDGSAIPDEYLTATEADKKYASKSKVSQLQSEKADKSTLQNNYLQKSTAQQTYLTKAAASQTYATQSTVSSQESRLSSLETDVMDLNQNKIDASTVENNYLKKSKASQTYATQSSLDSAKSRISALEGKTRDMTRTSINGYQSLVFEGVNVHVRNGIGNTESKDGTGNLVLGYGETDSDDTQNGSHNLVVGMNHTYTSYGGVVAGKDNKATGSYASLIGSKSSRVSGSFAAVCGGDLNIASGKYASVTGGSDNEAKSKGATVAGGFLNTASGNYSTVSGGSINDATGDWSSVSGGTNNTASGDDSTVSGGNSRSVSGQDDWRAGAQFEDH